MIYVECKPDQALARFVANVPKRQVTHENGRNQVCNRLTKQRKCLGVVDEDPKAAQHPYTRRMTVNEELPRLGLRVLVDASRANRLIVVCPRLENWILAAANEAGVDVERFGLPKDWRGLHSVINLRLDEFEKLLRSLRHADRLRALGRLLRSSR